MKQVFIFLILFLITNFSFAQQSDKKESLLPSCLPYDIESSATRASLEEWSKGCLPQNRVRRPMLIEKKIDQDGVPSLSVYFLMRIEIKRSSEKSLEDIVLEIDSTLKALNESGNKIGVSFISYSEVWKNGQMLKAIGTKRDVPASFQPIRVSVWGNKTLLSKITNGRSFLLPWLARVELIDNVEDEGLLHELSHVLFLNWDAYDKKYSQHVEFLNAENCESDYIDPLEIFVGLRRQGYWLEHWDEYVDQINNEHVLEATKEKIYWENWNKEMAKLQTEMAKVQKETERLLKINFDK